jgi:hypothetical protein
VKGQAWGQASSSSAIHLFFGFVQGKIPCHRNGQYEALHLVDNEQFDLKNKIS